MEALFRRLCSLLMLVGGLAVLALIANVSADVVAKYVWNAPIQGTVEISSYYYMVAVVMLPLAFVELEDEQISVDLAFNHFPPWMQRISLMLTCLATAGILWVMAWRTGLDAVRAWTVGEVVMGSREVVVWPGRVLLPVGFALAGLAALVRLGLVTRGKYTVKHADDGGTA